MVRGNYRGRGAKFGGAGNPRGGGGASQVGGPLMTNHLRDLDIELKLLQRKRQIFEQEQNMLNRFANSTSNHSSTNSYQYSGGSNQYSGGSNKYSGGSNQYSTNSNTYSDNSNTRQYDNKQPLLNYSQQGNSNQFNFANHSAAYQPGPGSSSFKPQGVKRQAYTSIWQNQDPPPPKRFNASQSINPWQNPNTRQAEFRAVNQNPPQPKNFSAQPRSLMAQKPGISQRIKNKYNPPPERKNFKPNKVTKPNQKPAAKAPVYRPSIETKKLIDETNKLIAHTNKIVGQTLKPKGQNPPPKRLQNPPPKGLQNPPPKGLQNPPPKVYTPSPKLINTPPKSQNPALNAIPKHMKRRFEQDNVLHPNRQPSGQIKGRLELALGMILKSVKELCPDPGTLEYFNIPFIQRVIKHTLRVRIRNVMMNEPIDNVRNIVDKYREKYPQTTDIELMKVAQDAHSYNNNQPRVLQLVEADDPEEFFKKNIGRILDNKLRNVFSDLKKLYENKDYKIEELVESFTTEAPKENKNEDETQGNENGGKDTSGEIVKSGAKDSEGKMDTSEEKDTNGEIVTIEDEDTSGENDIEADRDKDGGKGAEDAKSTNDEKEKDTDQGKDNKNGEDTEKKEAANGNKNHTEESSEDIKMVVDQLQNKTSKVQKYVEFMEKVMEQKLPRMLHNFRDELMSILCLDKEFVGMKALITLEMKSKLRQALEKENVTTINDDMETSHSGKTPTPKKSTAVVNSNAAATAAKHATTAATPGVSTAKPAATAAKPASTTAKPASTTAKPAANAAKTAATAAKPAAPSPTAKSAATPTKPAAPSPNVKSAATATKPVAQSITAVQPVIASTPATPVTASTTPSKRVAASTPPGKPATTTQAVPPATSTIAAKPTTPVKPATTPVKPVTAAGIPVTAAEKSATSASAQSTPITPAKVAEKIVPATPKTPASKDIQYVKLIGRPALPARAAIYDFLNQFSPASIKKHKSINNLLVVGFVNKEGFDKILAANESVVGDATIIIKASEQVNTPGQNKTPQQGGNQTGPQGNKIPAQNKESVQNKANNQENKTQESEQNDKIPAQTDTSKDITEENKSTDENILDSSTDDIINSDLDSQISDLLSSIRKSDEEARANQNKPKDGEKMYTKDVDDEVCDLTKNETDQNEETDKVDGKKKSATDDSNTATKDLDAIMEVDDETKQSEDIKAKAVEEVAKTAKESGRATPTRSSSRLANVTPSTIKTRRASRLANN